MRMVISDNQYLQVVSGVAVKYIFAGHFIFALKTIAKIKLPRIVNEKQPST